MRLKNLLRLHPGHLLIPRIFDLKARLSADSSRHPSPLTSVLLPIGIAVLFVHHRFQIRTVARQLLASERTLVVALTNLAGILILEVWPEVLLRRRHIQMYLLLEPISLLLC